MTKESKFKNYISAFLGKISLSDTLSKMEEITNISVCIRKREIELFV